MSEDADNALRRSKRNKFHLDVAAIHHGRSRSPALQHLTVVQNPSPSLLAKMSPRPSPSITPAAVAVSVPAAVAPPPPIMVATSSQQIFITPVPLKTTSTLIKYPVITPKIVYPPSMMKANTVPRMRPVMIPGNNLGKRKRKIPVDNDFFYAVDSDYDSDVTVILAAPVTATTTDASAIRYDNEFPCPRCPAHFESRVGLTNHLKLHGANKTFPCYNCDFSCTNRKTMRQHKRVHGQQSPVRKRKSTDHKKVSPFAADGIVKAEVKKPKRSFPCPWCPFKTRTFARLIPHKLGHFRAYGYQCPHCSFRASSRGSLMSHLTVHGSKSTPLPTPSEVFYVWTSDPDATPQPTELKKHRFEAERPVLRCKKCNFESRLRRRFERHQKKHESAQIKTRISPENIHPKTEESAATGASIQPSQPDHVTSTSDLTLLDSSNDDSLTLAPHQKRKGCTRCGKTFSTLGQYMVHYHLKHFPNRRSQRPHCREYLQERIGYPEFLDEMKKDNKDSSDLIRHIAALGPQTMTGQIGPVIGGVGAFNCHQCPFRAKTQAKLSTHENKHKMKAELQCARCTYSCKTHISLVRHNALHDIGLAIKQEVPDVPRASASTASASSLQNSLESAKKNDQHSYLRCPHCPYRSKHGCDLKAHYKMHGDRGTFRCPYCTYSTMRLNALKTHVCLHEQELGHLSTDSSTPTPAQPMVQKLPEKDREAEFVPREVVYKKIWDENRENVIGKKLMKANGSTVYRCASCPYEAKYPSTLNQHIRHHQRGSKYRCPKCSYTTERDDLLPKHIDSHQNEPAPEGGWFCSACPYRADSYGKQWHHVQKHKKVGRFNCEICKFGVGSIQSYTDHMALHGIKVTSMQPPASTDANKQASIESCSATTTDIASTVTEPRTPDGSCSSDKDKSEERSTTSSLPGIALAQDFEMDMDWSGASPTPPVLAMYQARTNTASPLSTGPVTRNKRPTPSKRQQILKPPTPSIGPYKNNIQLDLPPLPAVIKPKRKRQVSGSSGSGIHSNDIDEDEKVHECKHCPFTCLDSKMLKFHTRMHEGDRPQRCAMCTFSCFNTDALYSHMNVHAPQLPESMLIAMRKKLAQRRRNGSLQEREILPANATNVYRCQQCPFKTAFQDRFLQHRMEHVQHLQQRLMTQMKRAANDDKDGKRNKALTRKKAERKWNYCNICSFRSDTVVALMNHQEFHGNRNNVFSCRYCNYCANSLDVVTFHERNHHMDLPATNQSLNSVAVNGIVDSDLLSEKRQKYSCQKCSYSCHELSDFIRHFEDNHVDDSAVIEKLRMGLLPTLPLRTSQSCQAAIVQEQMSPQIVTQL